jgi:hypothetical protein
MLDDWKNAFIRNHGRGEIQIMLMYKRPVTIHFRVRFIHRMSSRNVGIVLAEIFQLDCSNCVAEVLCCGKKHDNTHILIELQSPLSTYVVLLA